MNDRNACFREVNTAVPIALGAFVLGAALPQLAPVGTTFFFACAVATFAFALLARRRFPRSRPILIVSLALAGLAIGTLFATLRQPVFPEDVPLGRRGINAIVVREPDIRENHTAYVVEITSIDGRSPIVPYRLLLLAPRYPELAYGDRIVAIGTISLPEDFPTDDAGRMFPYREFLAKDGIRALMRYPSIERVSSGEGNVVAGILVGTKHRFLEALARVVPEPENALLAGLLLGAKRSLGEQITNDLRAAGIVHIIVLSGYNMTLVAQYLHACFRFLGFYGSAAAGIVGIIFFSVMAGGGATVVRAAIMASLALLARVTGRTDAANRALFIAAAAMVAFEPRIVLYDPSFQLSFLATLGLIHGVPFLEPRIRWFSRYPLIRDIVLSTLATQLFVLPLLLYQNGVFPLYALVANVLALPAVPIAMFLGFWAGIAALVAWPLGMCIGVFAFLPAKWILLVGSSVASLPYATIHLPPFSPFILVTAYALLGVLLYRSRSSSSVPFSQPSGESLRN
jgi:competence protein ComEC